MGHTSTGNVPFKKYGGGHLELIKGIDVSRWQGEIDWQAVKNSGIRFAIAKITGADAGLYTDRMALKNVQGIRDAGLMAGGYHYAFFKNTGEALREAEYFKSAASGLGLDFVVLDIEYQNASGDLTDASLEFLDSVSSIARPLIYANPSFIKSHFNSRITRYPLWIAHYYVNEPSVPLWDDWYIWQQTDKGAVPGISGNVDIDVMKPEFFNWEDKMQNLILYYSEGDARAVQLLSSYLHAPAIMKGDELRQDVDGAVNLYEVGGDQKYQRSKLLSGSDWVDTYKAVLRFVGRL